MKIELDEIIFYRTLICIVHPDTLKQIDLSKFSDNIWFVTMEEAAKNKLYNIIETHAKRDIYDLCMTDPKMCVKGLIPYKGVTI